MTEPVKERIELIPEEAGAFDKELQGRMAEFYAEVSSSPAWNGARVG